MRARYDERYGSQRMEKAAWSGRIKPTRIDSGSHLMFLISARTSANLQDLSPMVVLGNNRCLQPVIRAPVSPSCHSLSVSQRQGIAKMRGRDESAMLWLGRVWRRLHRWSIARVGQGGFARIWASRAETTRRGSLRGEAEYGAERIRMSIFEGSRFHQIPVNTEESRYCPYPAVT